jgi:hypothetical protein
MKVLILGLILFSSINSFSKNKKKENIIYKYKKYEKFNLEDISVDGETGVPGDISLINRYQRKFKNKLPYRRNFRPEIVFGVERLK